MALAVVLASLLTACGGGQDGPRTFWNADEVVAAAGLTRPLDGGAAEAWELRTPDGAVCRVAGILTSAGQVTEYRTAGEVVATNPAGSAGVRIDAARTERPALCRARLTEALGSLR